MTASSLPRNNLKTAHDEYAMKPTHDTYPVFEANQVLTNSHLNMIVDYLDDQQRLTRPNLVGVGIMCGLDVVINGDRTVTVSQGCAVTTHGYLISQADESITFRGYRAYAPRLGNGNEPLGTLLSMTQPPQIWELLKEEGTQPLPNVTSGTHSVMLFVELDTENLANCSPNNCDDKGSEVHVTLRYLVVEKSLAEQLAEPLAELPNPKRIARDLPELSIRRYTWNKQSVTSTESVLEAFQSIIKESQLVSRVQSALTMCWSELRGLVGNEFSTNPFGSFSDRYGFLESNPTVASQVRFLQYYVDHFSDIIAAYDELRGSIPDHLCLCMPSDEYFPQHVILGPKNRTPWYPARAAGGDCELALDRIRLLFRRLVELVTSFTESPVLASNPGPIRVTPSVIGTAPLSQRSIPYYYRLSAPTPLYLVWNPDLARLSRAHHNLSYRSFEYTQQPTPDFVSEPLDYSIEKYNFFRVEGHLGLEVAQVTESLMAMRSRYGLSFDVVAVSTGQFNPQKPIDAAKYSCHFDDLQSVYASLRKEYLCLLSKAMKTVGRTKYTKQSNATSVNVGSVISPAAGSMLMKETSKMPAAAVNAVHNADINRVALYELQYDDAEPDTIGYEFVNSWRGTDSCNLMSGDTDVDYTYRAMSLIAQMPLVMSAELMKLDMGALIKHVGLMTDYAVQVKQLPSDKLASLYEQMMNVVAACRLEGLKTIREELNRRADEVRRLQYLDRYVKDHPSLQHMAGVPDGGTLVLVYHEPNPDTSNTTPSKYPLVKDFKAGEVIADFFLPYKCCSDCPPIHMTFRPVDPLTVEATAGCTSEKGSRVGVVIGGGNPPYKLVVDDGESMSPAPGSVILTAGAHKITALDSSGMEKSISVSVPLQLTAVAAYRTSDNGKTYEAVLTVSGGTGSYSSSGYEVEGNTVLVRGLEPSAKRSVIISDSKGCVLTMELVAPSPIEVSTIVGCAYDNAAKVQVSISGGMPGYVLTSDGESYNEFPTVLSRKPGTHTLTVVDSQGVVRTVEVVVHEQLSAKVNYQTRDRGKTYTANVTVAGGSGTYESPGNAVDGDTVLVSGLAPGEGRIVQVVDAKGCSLDVHLQALTEITVVTDVGCTKGGIANVRVSATGGAAGHVLTYANQTADLPTILKLEPGTHQMVVTDSVGADRTVTISVAEELSATISYRAVDGGIQYVAIVTVSGGSGGYNSVGAIIEGKTVVVPGLKPSETRPIEITDSRGCSLMVELAVPAPIELVTDVGCTTENGATVSVKVSGGTPGYKLSYPGGVTDSIPANIVLKEGVHELLVTDAHGATRIASVSVMERLQATKPVIDQQPGQSLFSATFTMTGGSGSYITQDGTIDGSKVRVAGLAPNITKIIRVIDAKKVSCGIDVTVSTPEAPCDRPCKGLAVRKRYPAWMPRPAGGRSYKVTSVTKLTVKLFDENNATVLSLNLIEPALKLLTPVLEITETNYDRLMTAVVKEFMRLIAANLKDDRLVLAFTPGGLGGLTIERYACHTVEMEVAFETKGTFLSLNEQWIYRNDNVLVTSRSSNKESLLPAFGEIDMDKCAGTQGIDCRLEVNTLSIVRSQTGSVVRPVIPAGTANPIVYWRIDTASGTQFSNVQELALTASMLPAIVHLLVVDRKGCWTYGQAELSRDSGSAVKMTVLG